MDAARLIVAQCAMCFRTAAAQSAASAHVLNQAILILAAPAILAFAGLLWLARHREKPH